MLDGTWQPGSTSAVGKWMGVRSLWNLGAEPADRDNHVSALGSLAHRELVAAETASEAAGLDERVRLDAAWRMLIGRRHPAAHGNDGNDDGLTHHDS